MNPEEQDKKPPLEQILKPTKSLRTYQGDVQEAISKHNYSSKDIFLAEQDKRMEESEKPTIFKDPVVKNKLLAVSGVIFFVLGIGIVGTVYYLRSNEEVILQQKTKALIGFSEEKVFSIATTTREKLVKQIQEEKSSLNLPVNSVFYINTVGADEQPANVESLLSILTPKMPNSLSRSFASKYMIGIFSFDTNEPFIMLTTDDYGLSFAGMLKWEKDIPSDLGKLFGIVQNASSTLQIFVDQERRNKDLRVLRDNQGKIVLLYSFIDQNTLLITKNESIFNAILSKYLISQQEK